MTIALTPLFDSDEQVPVPRVDIRRNGWKLISSPGTDPDVLPLRKVVGIRLSKDIPVNRHTVLLFLLKHADKGKRFNLLGPQSWQALHAWGGVRAASAPDIGFTDFTFLFGGLLTRESDGRLDILCGRHNTGKNRMEWGPRHIYHGFQKNDFFIALQLD